MTELSDAIAGRKGFDRLTDPERAAAERSLHLATCQVPALADCGRCTWELDEIRNVLAAAAPVIERQAGAEAAELLADMVVRCTEHGTQDDNGDGGFVASYLLPTGPIHRAIPWLQERGIVVRPGRDGRRDERASS